MPDPDRLSEDARAIWSAGVAAVHAQRLIRTAVRIEDHDLVVCGHRLARDQVGRVVVVGAGKAGAGMAAGVEQALAEGDWADKLEGWVNVPADCVRPSPRIHLHAARPPGLNEPTLEGVRGAREVLRRVQSLGPSDVCLVLISGGGSALLPAPRPPLTLADKQAVTRWLMHSGATIRELNTVRKQLSLVKGGKLAQAAPAGHLIGLIISDVVGDPLDVIASGPTCPDGSTAQEARDVLRRYGACPPRVPQAVLDLLDAAPARAAAPGAGLGGARVWNHVIGNNARALEAAAREARQRGYEVCALGSDNQGEANQEGWDLAERCRAERDRRARGEPPLCLLSGGEPVVHLAATDQPRKGGRNQQLVLAALTRLRDGGLEGIVVLSGGTDGEDGPTDAAGAWADAQLLAAANRLGLDPRPYLEVNNAYAFFAPLGGLLKTGPTQTNVMDLRVALVDGGGPPQRQYAAPA